MTDSGDVELLEWGRRLRDWRKLRQLSQVELAKQISEHLGRKIGQDAVSQWEQGKRRPTDVQRIALARLLDAPVPALFPYPPDVR